MTPEPEPMRLRRLDGRIFLFAAFLAIAGLILFAGGAMLHRNDLISTLIVMTLLVAYGGLSALSGLVLSAATLLTLLRRRRLPPLLPFLAALVAVLAIAAPALMAAVDVATHPMLADVSTDLASPPGFQALSKRPDGFANDLGHFTGDAARQTAAYPELQPQRYAAAPDAVVAAVERVVVSLPAEDTAMREEPDGSVLVEFTWRPGLFRFANVFVLRLKQEGAGTRVDLRGASRYGSHDLGANARLIGEIFRRLDDQFPGRPAG